MEVALLSSTPLPLQTIVAAKGLIEGLHINPEDIDYEHAKKEVGDCFQSAIYTPFEFVSFVFDIRGVSRAFTHQLVRTRAAAYVQESLRFSTRKGGFYYGTPKAISEDTKSWVLYTNLMRRIGECYDMLVDCGIPIEDARAVLPQSTLTSICMTINYRSLINMLEQRLCHQSQAEHREFASEVKQLVLALCPPLGEFLAPSCVHKGYCSWGGRLDRPCELQSRYPVRSDYERR